ncbi:MAG: hypothetical protein DHS20C10_01560 [marine bacterium B5-7]|nr:MAG: hypothetical protein DHS20C10_01560 [marine bacterium B5-7]
MMIKKNDGLTAIALTLVSLFLFVLPLFSRHFIGLEARFYLFTRDMFLHGAHIFPQLYGKFYADYLGTPFVFSALSAKLFGHLTLQTAAFPTQCFSAASIGLLFYHLSKQDKPWAWCAVAMLLVCYQFILSAMQFAIDPALLFACCLAFISAREKQIGGIVIAYFIAFAFRGSIGVILCAVPPLAVHLGDFRAKVAFKGLMLAAFLLTLGIAAHLALAFHVGGETFVKQTLHMQALGRLQTHTENVWYYLPVILLNFALPGLLAIFATIIALPRFLSRKVDGTLLRQCIIWVVIVLLGMSIPGEKRPRYILSMTPALAIISAYLFLGVSRLKTWPKLPALLGSLVVFLLAMMAFVVTPGMAHHDDASRFAKQLAQQKTLHFYHMNPDQEAIKLLAELPADVKPVFSDKTKPGVQYITRKVFLPPDVNVIFSGEIGHKQCVLFQLK